MEVKAGRRRRPRVVGVVVGRDMFLVFGLEGFFAKAAVLCGTFVVIVVVVVVVVNRDDNVVLVLRSIPKNESLR